MADFVASLSEGAPLSVEEQWRAELRAELEYARDRMTQLIDHMRVSVDEWANDLKTSIGSMKTRVEAILDAIEDEKEGNGESMLELVNLNQTEAPEECYEDSGMKVVDNNVLKAITMVGLTFELCNEPKFDIMSCKMGTGDVKPLSTGSVRDVQPFIANYMFGYVGINLIKPFFLSSVLVCENFDRAISMVFEWGNKLIAVCDPYRFRLLVMGWRSNSIVEQFEAQMAADEKLKLFYGVCMVPGNPTIDYPELEVVSRVDLTTNELRSLFESTNSHYYLLAIPSLALKATQIFYSLVGSSCLDIKMRPRDETMKLFEEMLVKSIVMQDVIIYNVSFDGKPSVAMNGFIWFRNVALANLSEHKFWNFMRELKGGIIVGSVFQSTLQFSGLILIAFSLVFVSDSKSWENNLVECVKAFEKHTRIELDANLGLVISAQANEHIYRLVPGVDSDAKFLFEGEFIKFVFIHGNLYGTNIEVVETVANSEKMCILDIVIQGARLLRAYSLDAILIFISSPTMRELEEWLGYVTEQLSCLIGPAVDRLLNAFIGSATELIILILALKNGMICVVQQLLLCSILSNMLLVLGYAFLGRGLVTLKKEQVFHKTATFKVNSGLLLMSVKGLRFYDVLHYTHTELHFGKFELALSWFTSWVMTLYQRPIIDCIKLVGATHHGTTSESVNKHCVTGTMMIIGSIFGCSSSFILQSFKLKKYPARSSLTTCVCFMAILVESEQVLSSFALLERSCVCLDDFVFGIVVHGCLSFAVFRIGKMIYDVVIKDGFQVYVCVGYVLSIMNDKAWEIDQKLKVYEKPTSASIAAMQTINNVGYVFLKGRHIFTRVSRVTGAFNSFTKATSDVQEKRRMEALAGM